MLVNPVYAPVMRASGTVPAVKDDASNAVIGIVIFADPLNEVAVPVAPPDVAIVLAVCRVVAVVALPDRAPVNVAAVIVPDAVRSVIPVYAPVIRASGTVPVVKDDASNAVIGFVMFAEPSKEVAVPVAPPDVAIVLAVCRIVAVPALPVVVVAVVAVVADVALPDRAPLNVVAVIVPDAVRLVIPVYAPVIRALGTVPVDSNDASNAVIGIVIFAEPSKEVAVPVAPPDVAIVLAVCRVDAVVALPVKAPLNVAAVAVPEIVMLDGRLNVTAPVDADTAIWFGVPVKDNTPVFEITLPVTSIPVPAVTVPDPEN